MFWAKRRKQNGIATHTKLSSGRIYVFMIVSVLTGVFPSFIPLNEADDEKDQDEQRNGAHEANEPSLSGDVHLSARHSWPEEEEEEKTHNL